MVKRIIDSDDIDSHTGCPYLSEAELEAIVESAANRAAAKVLDGVYIKVGRSIVTKAFYVVGIGVLALAAWLNSKGMI